MQRQQQHMARANKILVLVEQKPKFYWIEVAFPNEKHLSWKKYTEFYFKDIPDTQPDLRSVIFYFKEKQVITVSL